MHIFHKGKRQPAKPGVDKGQAIKGDKRVEMQGDERAGEMHCIGRKLPTNHHAHHLDHNPQPAPVTVTAQDHAALLVSDREMQVAQRQEPQGGDLPGMQLPA